MKSSELQFNIIFTPHTVACLAPFIESLLHWSDCSYRIVANACLPAEKSLLRELCSGSARLEYLDGPREIMVDHGSMLNWLHERTDSPWFCFMDSDILATAPFAAELIAYLEHCDVFSSGHPLWYAPEDIVLPPAFRRLHGIHFGTSDGITLGSTYFAVYDNRILSAAMAATGIDFRTRHWEQVPERHRAALAGAGLDKLEYDTGLLLMSLMHLRGARLCVAEMPQLVHLGGFSARAEDEPADYCRGLPDRIAVAFGRRAAQYLLYLADSWYAIRRTSPGVTAAESRAMPFNERRILEGRIRKRLGTARYFKKLLQNLLADAPPPPLPILGYPPAERRIAAATAHIAQHYSEPGLHRAGPKSSPAKS